MAWERRTLPLCDREKLGAYFHSYLYALLFSGEEWWPQIIPYETGKTIWHNCVRGREAKPLWNLVALEFWARNFLA